MFCRCAIVNATKRETNQKGKKMKNQKLVLKQANQGRIDLAAVNLFNSNKTFSLKLKLAWLKFLVKKTGDSSLSHFAMARHAKLFLIENN